MKPLPASLHSDKTHTKTPAADNGQWPEQQMASVSVPERRQKELRQRMQRFQQFIALQRKAFAEHPERARNSAPTAPHYQNEHFLDTGTGNAGEVARKSIKVTISGIERGRRIANDDSAEMQATNVVKNTHPIEKSEIQSTTTSPTSPSLKHSNKHVDKINPSINITTQSISETTQQLTLKKLDLHSLTNTNLVEIIPQPQFLRYLTSSVQDLIRSFADRLAITFDLPDNKDIEGLIMAIRDVRSWDMAPYIVRTAKFKRRCSYKYSLILQDDFGNRVLLLQFEPTNKAAKFARAEFSRPALQGDGLKWVRKILKAIVGPNYRSQLAKGNLTRMDATADVAGQLVNEIVLVSNRARKSSVWQRSFDQNGVETWATETLAVGSETSDYFAQVYDKAAQMWRIKNVNLDKALARIEVRFTPRVKNKSVAVSQLMSLKNPFSVISVSRYPNLDDESPWFEFFLHAARSIGVEAALKMLSGKNKSKRSLYRQKFAEYEPDWWQPDYIWMNVLADVKATGLLPDSIFNHANDDDRLQAQ